MTYTIRKLDDKGIFIEELIFCTYHITAVLFLLFSF